MKKYMLTSRKRFSLIFDQALSLLAIKIERITSREFQFEFWILDETHGQNVKTNLFSSNMIIRLNLCYECLLIHCVHQVQIISDWDVFLIIFKQWFVKCFDWIKLKNRPRFLIFGNQWLARKTRNTENKYVSSYTMPLCTCMHVCISGFL